MNKEQAIQILGQMHYSYCPGTLMAERAAEARKYLVEAGHTVSVISRQCQMGSNPSSMVYVDGCQVA